MVAPASSGVLRELLAAMFGFYNAVRWHRGSASVGEAVEQSVAELPCRRRIVFDLARRKPRQKQPPGPGVDRRIRRDRRHAGSEQRRLTVALTFGTTYSSGSLTFGGGDSGELIEELMERLDSI